jgi:hypothetical protein
MVEWRRRKKGTPNQIGKPFPIEPHGDKGNLPKALRKVSLSEITDEIQGRRRKNMTEEELEEEEMIEQALEEEKQEKTIAKRLKNGLEKLDEALKKEQKRQRLKKALEEAKAEQQANEGDIDEGYGNAWQKRLERVRKANEDPNEVFG